MAKFPEEAKKIIDRLGPAPVAIAKKPGISIKRLFAFLKS